MPVIGGKEFNLLRDEDFLPPCLRIDIVLCSPDPSNENTYILNDVLVNTGSDFTIINEIYIGLIDLIETGEDAGEIIDIRGNISECKFYSARIIIDGIFDEIIEVVGLRDSLDAEPVIGMDIFSKLHWLINGPNETFEIANPDTYVAPTP